MVGVAVSILNSKCSLSKDKPFDRPPVSFGFATDLEFTLVSRHYAVIVSRIITE